MIIQTHYGKFKTNGKEKIINDLSIYDGEEPIDDLGYLGEKIPKDLYNFVVSERKLITEKNFRIERDSYLNKVDIAINKAEDLGQDSTSLRELRQALRDATINLVMPDLSLLK